VLHGIDDVLDIVAVGQQDKGGPAEHIGILERGGADAEDDDMRVAQRAGGVEQVDGTAHRDDMKIGGAVLELASQTLAGEGPAIDQHNLCTC
jgi:hypothetical protein